MLSQEGVTGNSSLAAVGMIVGAEGLGIKQVFVCFHLRFLRNSFNNISRAGFSGSGSNTIGLQQVLCENSCVNIKV